MEHRLDAGKIADFRETPEGFLDVFMSFSRIGPLVYQRTDGALETEHLTEEELFNEDSLASATGKPVTWNHPPEWVTKDNARQYLRGSTSAKIIKDTPFATILATIHDAELIDVIKSGKAQQVSMGYTTEVVKRDDGKLYQTKRRYNHAAIVPAGRAGSDVRVHYDGVDDVAVQVPPKEYIGTITMITELRIDDKTTLKIGTSEGEQAIARYFRDALDSNKDWNSKLAQAEAKIDQLQTKLDQTIADCDKQKARADIAESKLVEAEEKKADADQIKTAFDQGYQRHVLEITAVKFLPSDIKIDAATSDKDIKLSVIKNQILLKADSDEAKRYDAQSDAYVDAAYDLIVNADSSLNLRASANNAERNDMRINSKQTPGEQMHDRARGRNTKKLSLSRA